MSRERPALDHDFNSDANYSLHSSQPTRCGNSSSSGSIGDRHITTESNGLVSQLTLQTWYPVWLNIPMKTINGQPARGVLGPWGAVNDATEALEVRYLPPAADGTANGAADGTVNGAADDGPATGRFQRDRRPGPADTRSDNRCRPIGEGESHPAPGDLVLLPLLDLRLDDTLLYSRVLDVACMRTPTLYM
eukprot:Em0019g89a